MAKDHEILTLTEAADLLRISRNYAYQVYPKWREFGVRILRMAPNSPPRFYKADILRMLEKTK